MKILKTLKNTILGMKDIEVSGNMHVNTLCAIFREQYGVGMRVYKLNSDGKIFTGRGAKKAEPNSTLASVSTGKVGSITLKKSMTVQQVEDAFANSMGVGVQIEDAEGKLANNQIRLSDLRK